MPRYVIVATMASAPITYLYEHPDKALAKIRTLQRQAIPFELKDGDSGRAMAVSDLETRVGD